MRLGMIAVAAGLAALTSACAGGGRVAELNCGVAADGLLSDCFIVSETPQGGGYGAIAAAQADGTRVSADTMRNPPATGRINFVVRENP